MTWHLLMTHYDICPSNHVAHPNVIQGFVDSFDSAKPVEIGGYGFAWPGRKTVGLVRAVEKRDADLWGDVDWIEPMPDGLHIRSNWSFGPGDRVALSSCFLGHWPHHTSFDWCEEETEDYAPVSEDSEGELDDWGRGLAD